MDNNKINIDNLVRQRLEGGEEKEREGAWGNMSRLLDKEMPKRKPFDWLNRSHAYIALGVLSVLSLGILGSYELRTSKTTGISTATADNSTVATGKFTKPEQRGNIVASSSAGSANIAFNTTASGSSSATANCSDKNTSPAHTANAVTNNSVAQIITAAEHTLHSQHSTNTPVSETVVANSANTAVVPRNKSEKINSVSKNHQAQTNSVTTTAIVEKSQNNTVAGTVKHSNRKQTTSTPTTATAANNTGGWATKLRSKQSLKTGTNILSSATVNTAGHSTTGTVNDVVATSANRKKSKNTSSLPRNVGAVVSSTIGAPGADMSTALPTTIPSVVKKSFVTNGAVPVNATEKTVATHQPKQHTNHLNKTTSANNGSHSSLSKLASGNDEGSSTGSATVNKGNHISVRRKKTESIVLNKHFVSVAYNRAIFTVDTISRGKMYEMLESMPMAENIDANILNDGAGAVKPELAAAAPESVAPSLKTVVSSGIKKSSNMVVKKTIGGKLLESMSAAFNDIKYTSKAMTFTPGITAGINGTFFGPASFYGFQAGIVGDFNFGDYLTVSAELKYFERVNNTYQMNDDYYTYEVNSGGGYLRSKVDYSFSFSTLQSFELPILFKYNINSFTFMLGENNAYSFAIRTGAAPIPDPTFAPQKVSAIGNDNAPTLAKNDFGDRFGLGYILGAEYRFSPSIAMDFRMVQTVWDNASGNGAKTVSSNLYKSPSLQVSVGYKLGRSKARMENNTDVYKTE
jgi:Outer membrane protein beta-barrel domain